MKIKSTRAFLPALIFLTGLVVVFISISIPALAITPVSQSYLANKEIPLGSPIAGVGMKATTNTKIVAS